MTVKEQNEKKKEYLNQYKRKSRKIKSLTDQKQSVMELMQSAKAIEYDDMPKGHKQSDLSDYIVKLERLSEQIEDIKQWQDERVCEMKDKINKIEKDNERTVLLKKYLEFKTLKEIASEEGYSLSKAKSLHGYALIDLEM